MNSTRRSVGFISLAGLICLPALLLTGGILSAAQPAVARADGSPRERVSFNNGWRFQKGDPAEVGERLAYAKIKPWIMATGNDLLSPAAPAPVRPAGNPGGDVSYAQAGFDDRGWRLLNLPHDWGIEGPF